MTKPLSGAAGLLRKCYDDQDGDECAASTVAPYQLSACIHTKTIHCVYTMKRTNIVLDEKLVRQGLKTTGIKTRRALVNYALTE
jgi:hypothetical protein